MGGARLDKPVSQPPRSVIAELCARGLCRADQVAAPLPGGRTNDVWRFDSLAGEPCILKLYRDAESNVLFTNSQTLEAVCLTALSGTGLAPDLIASGRSGALDWIVYRRVEGTDWTYGSGTVAELLGRVHAHPPIPGLSERPGGSDALARQTLTILAQCQSARARDLAGVRPRGHVDPVRHLAVIHGDPVAGNIVVQGTRMTLIDWQCPAMGDPADDLAIFASPAMQMLYRGSALSAHETVSFMSAYPDAAVVARYRALRSWFHWRMAAYCLWQAERGRDGYGAAAELELAELSASVPAE